MDTDGPIEGTEPAAADTGAAPAPKMVSQEQVNDLVGRARVEARKVAEAEMARLQAERDELAAKVKAAEDAQLSEIERATKLANEAMMRAEQEAAARKASEVRAMRAEAVAIHGADLLPIYRAQVTGSDADTVLSSIDLLRKQQTEDAREHVRRVAALGDEERKTVLGDDLAGAFGAPRVPTPSIGSPPSAGATTEAKPTADTQNLSGASFAAWLERGRQARARSSPR
jgi:hypothetical protein